MINYFSRIVYYLYIPDNFGGCKKKCIVGINNCLECDEEGNLCITCDISYFHDENGGCSYTDNCEISNNGECIKCKNNFILIGIWYYYLISFKTSKINKIK